LNSEVVNSVLGISVFWGKTCSNCCHVSCPFGVNVQPFLVFKISSVSFRRVIMVLMVPFPTPILFASLFLPVGFCESCSKVQ